MAEHNLFGKTGEDQAVRFLESKGYTILERNWHSSHREIDIIALDGNWLVIVEVKTRSSRDYQSPWEAVTEEKQRLLIKAAHHYVCLKNIDLPVRFDIVSLVKGGPLPEGAVKQGEWVIEHIEDAFLAH